MLDRPLVQVSSNELEAWDALAREVGARPKMEAFCSLYDISVAALSNALQVSLVTARKIRRGASPITTWRRSQLVGLGFPESVLPSAGPDPGQWSRRAAAGSVV